MAVDMNNPVLKLKDGAILKIESSDTYSDGCPTCNYGAVYTNCIDIIFTKYRINIIIDDYNGYGISVGDIICFFGKNIDKIPTKSEYEFIELFKEFLFNKVKHIEYGIYENT